MSPGPQRHASRADHRFGGPEVLDVVDLPDPVPGDGEQLYEVTVAGIKFADTHHRQSHEVGQATACLQVRREILDLR